MNIIRTRWNKNDKWRYEICTDDDYDNYLQTESELGYIMDDNLRKIYSECEMELVYEGEIHISDGAKKLLLENVSIE